MSKRKNDKQEQNIEKLKIENLQKSYGDKLVVKDLSMDIKRGEVVGLLGPNGAGKTTSFYMVVGLIKPDEGEVYLNDLNITRMPMYKRAQMGIGYLPQEASIFRKLSVEDNVAAVEYFEFVIDKSEITNQTILVIKDFAEKKDIKDQTVVWDQQVKDLFHRLGN